MEKTALEVELSSEKKQEDCDVGRVCAGTEEAVSEIETLLKYEKDSESANSEGCGNEEQNMLNTDDNSQFYESNSDSKIDYAIKNDDNDTLSDIEDIKTDSASADSEDSALGSLPPDTAVIDREEEAQDRSDGSDSGIGSETIDDAKLHSYNDLVMPCTSGLNNVSKEMDLHSKLNTTVTCNETTKPLKSSLKRKNSEPDSEEPQIKKKKESIKFDNVTVYYFPRAQGFICVPSQGGSTLGMEWQHTHSQQFTLVEHAFEQRRLHRQLLQQLKSERQTLQGASLSSSEDSDTEEEASDISESELDLDSYYFLQPIPTRQRRVLLRSAGVRKIEPFEKDECRDIRTSREFCGCACKGACNPESCSCHQAGIKCQVDRLNFPCGCTRDGCGNGTGRIEFNPVRVRTHFIHTLMKLSMERKNEDKQGAVRKHWASTHNQNTLSNPAYNCHSSEEGLLCDVTLSPRVEVESCVNAGSFNNLHCDQQSNMSQNTMQGSMPYNFRNGSMNHNVISQNHVMPYGNTNSHCDHAVPYTSNILQGKGPPYSANTMLYNTMSSNMQNFPCDLNYTYDQRMNNHNNYKSLQTFSASSFEEFAHNSQMSMFSHYGQIYPDYMSKPSTSMHEHNNIQYHNVHQNHYEMYKTNSEVTQEKSDSQYTTLVSSYQNNKLQTVDNDQNWFSQNTLTSLDHVENATQDNTDLQQAAAETQQENNTNESPMENFGELIKKTMVESVSV